MSNLGVNITCVTSNMEARSSGVVLRCIVRLGSVIFILSFFFKDCYTDFGNKIKMTLLLCIIKSLDVFVLELKRNEWLNNVSPYFEEHQPNYYCEVFLFPFPFNSVSAIRTV